MDLSDPPVRAAAAQAAPGTADLTEGDATRQWLELVSEFGADVAGPLTTALERIDSLVASGRITRTDLRALREEVQQARQAGMLGQQLTILASGGQRQSPERLVLDETVQALLSRRAAEFPERTVAISVGTNRAEVLLDAALLCCMLDALLDWALGNSTGHCEFNTLYVDPRPRSTASAPRGGEQLSSERPSDSCSAQDRLLLECRFEPNRPEAALIDLAEPPRPHRVNALAWRVVEHTAATLELPLKVHDEAREVVLTLQFAPAAPEATAPQPSPPMLAEVADARPLAGRQVVVISSRRDMRVQIRDALRNMGLMIDFVSSINEAATYCSEGAPDAVIVEAIQRGERFDKFRAELCAGAPNTAFIEIVEKGRTFEKSGVGGAFLGRVGRDVIDSALPASLLHELTQR